MEFKSLQLENVIVLEDKKRKPLSTMDRSKRKGIYPYYGAQEIIDSIDDYIFDGKYILLAEDGENLKSRKKDLVKIVEGKFWLNNHAHIFKVKENVDLEYLYYYLLKLDLNEYITGSTQPKLNQENMNKIKIKLPELRIQKNISKILSNIDGKIKLNNEINNNLSEQIKFIYNEIFTEYDSYKRLSEISNVTIGKTPPRSESKYFTTDEKDIKWISISDLGKAGMFIFDTSERLTQDAIAKYNVKIIPKNTVILSFKLTVGRTGFTTENMATNEAIAHFDLFDKNLNNYLYCTLTYFNYSDLGSTSSIATAINSKIVKSIKIGIPNEKQLNKFNYLTSAMFKIIKNNENENVKLSGLRDTLLPKLMNGEIDLDNIEI